MTNYSRFLCPLIIGAFFTINLSCQKSSGGSAKTRKELLTSGSWKVSAVTVNPPVDYNGDGTDDTDIFALWEQCLKDDVTTFKADGTAKADEGATKCDPNDPQTSSLTWSLNSDDTKLTIDTEQYTIVELTSSKIVLSIEQVDNGKTYLQSVTFTH
jgi:hypothetical protein